MITSLTHRLADLFSRLPQVTAIALGGSLAAGSSDEQSDIDLYVFTSDEIPLASRQALVAASGGASRADLGLDYWGPGDQWFDASSGIEVDIVYFDGRWFEQELNRLLQLHQPAAGYSTCFWHICRTAKSLHDPTAWFAALQRRCLQPYPEPLRHAIIAHNHPLLRGIIPSYYQQLKKSWQRQDLISINHRLAALLASYFDILFALNRQTHPGEKRLIRMAIDYCPQRPQGMEADIKRLLQLAGTGDNELLPQLDQLLDRLDDLLAAEGIGRRC